MLYMLLLIMKNLYLPLSNMHFHVIAAFNPPTVKVNITITIYNTKQVGFDVRISHPPLKITSLNYIKTVFKLLLLFWINKYSFFSYDPLELRNFEIYNYRQQSKQNAIENLSYILFLWTGQTSTKKDMYVGSSEQHLSLQRFIKLIK